MTEHRETRDDYLRVCWIKGDYRIAECRLGLQWLFQRRRTRKSAGGAAWDTLGYCLTRNGLIRLHRAEFGPYDGELLQFPATFRSGVRSSAGPSGLTE